MASLSAGAGEPQQQTCNAALGRILCATVAARNAAQLTRCQAVAGQGPWRSGPAIQCTSCQAAALEPCHSGDRDVRLPWCLSMTLLSTQVE